MHGAFEWKGLEVPDTTGVGMALLALQAMAADRRTRPDACAIGRADLDSLNREDIVGDRNKVIEQFLSDASAPVEWAGEEDKKLHYWFDDLHCPQPISPMYFDVGGWWHTCGYMFRRFGVPFGKDRVAKRVR